MIANLVRALSGVAAIGMAVSLTSCDDKTIHIDGQKGVPLAELDLSGPAPETVTLLGPDTVHITRGDRLAITVEGDGTARSQLRFVLDKGNLAIARKQWNVASGGGTAVVNVVLPSPRNLVLAGSGSIDADQLSGDASMTIAGSGKVGAGRIDADKLKVDVLGTGSLQAGGHARELALMIAGTGKADMPGLSTDRAKIDLAGSGGAVFASDGDVSANIVGSGEVRVRGRAVCKVTSLGSGKLVCEPAA